MPNIIINGTTVPIPDSGTSANWSSSVIQAFQLLAQALAVSSSSSDIPPQIYVMGSNVNTNVDISNLSFSTTKVSGAVIFYNVSRSTDSSNASETGTIYLNYNPAASPGSKWQVSREYTNTGAQISFNVTDVGQVQFTTTSLAGNNHTGFIFFRALAVLNNS